MKTAGAVLAVALVVAVVVSLFTLFRGDRPIGSENLIGKPLPPFAAPLAGSGLDGDANVYTPEEAAAEGAKAACDVHIKGSITSCDGLKGAAVLLFWNTTKSECVDQVGQLEQALKRRQQVDSIALAFEDTMARVTAATKTHGWKRPVAVDPDGAVASLYSVAGCPSTYYAKDGVIRGVKLGVQSPEQIEADLKRYTDG